ncbi:MAG TPA: arginine deiminase family protein [Candidatus Baltobacteraceae bacterium]|nr:arginine deiminase family protein [Candidatus Baltobacteraceae bacterium]
MSYRFSLAIARLPGSTFAQGLTRAAFGVPDFATTLAQHRAYCAALEDAGLEVTVLGADNAFPDSTFVEDAAVVAGGRAIITRPGAQSREGETAAIRSALDEHFDSLASIEAPGTLDGGDVCESDGRVYVGISHRTNRSGAEQLAAWLKHGGIDTVFVDIRDLDAILHLKSGMSYVGDGVFVVDEALLSRVPLDGADVIVPAGAEAYGSNCVRVNEVVFLASGHPRLESELETRGMRVVTLDVSEYQKMDGGLSCLSIRF